MTAVERAAYGAGGLLILSGVIHLAVLLMSGGAWDGPLSLRKPATFGLSFGLTLINVTVIASLVPLRDRSRRRLLAAKHGHDICPRHATERDASGECGCGEEQRASGDDADGVVRQDGIQADCRKQECREAEDTEEKCVESRPRQGARKHVRERHDVHEPHIGIHGLEAVIHQRGEQLEPRRTPHREHRRGHLKLRGRKIERRLRAQDRAASSLARDADNRVPAETRVYRPQASIACQWDPPAARPV